MTCRTDKAGGFSAKRVLALALAAVTACSLSFPSLALAVVRVDETELAQGENAVGGGKATLTDSSLEMTDVTANELYTDEDLSVNFNGGNTLEYVSAGGEAEVELSFTGENAVENVMAAENSDVTINADGHNDFEEVMAMGNSNVTVNVTGENDFETIGALDDASVTVRGTDCQKRDIVNLGEGDTYTVLNAERGDVTIDHVTVNVKAEKADIGSEEGNLVIVTSKIAKDDGNEYAKITAGKTMNIKESVIDIAGTVHSKGKMTIDHSDVKAEKPDAKYGDTSPYRVYSETGIELIDEENGEVEEGEIDGKKVWYVDTEDNDGEEVDLEADGDPAYYRCCGKKECMKAAVPGTGDGNDPALPMAMGFAGAAMVAYAAMRRGRQRLGFARVATARASSGLSAAITPEQARSRREEERSSDRLASPRFRGGTASLHAPRQSRRTRDRMKGGF